MLSSTPLPAASYAHGLASAAIALRVPVGEAGDGDADDQEQDGGDDVAGVVEGAGVEDLGLSHTLPHAEHEHQRDVLLQTDEAVQEGGDDVSDCLRNQNVAKRLHLG